MTITFRQESKTSGRQSSVDTEERGTELHGTLYILRKKDYAVGFNRKV